MDNIQLDYKEAYQKANGKAVKITKHTEVRYFIKGDPHGYTAVQIAGFTQTLLKR